MALCMVMESHFQPAESVHPGGASVQVVGFGLGASSMGIRGFDPMGSCSQESSR